MRQGAAGDTFFIIKKGRVSFDLSYYFYVTFFFVKNTLFLGKSDNERRDRKRREVYSEPS